MANENRWFFSEHELNNTPSSQNGMDKDKELYCRQQAASYIQEIGQKLAVNQLVINTAIVFTHRFFMLHSFTRFDRQKIATACMFLSCKVEEQPRKLAHVIKVYCYLRGIETPPVESENYTRISQEIADNENLVLETLGFDIRVEHPHSHVVRTCELVKAHRDLAQTSYFLATNSLHLTDMCLRYKSSVIACVCVHLACKWSDYQIPHSSEGKEWYNYVDPDVELELLERLTDDFLAIIDKCPIKLKKKIMTWKAGGGRDDIMAGGTVPNPQPRPTAPPSSSSSASRPSASMAAPSSSSSSSQPSRPPPPPPPKREEGMRRVSTEPINLQQAAKSSAPAPSPAPNKVQYKDYVKNRAKPPAPTTTASSSATSGSVPVSASSGSHPRHAEKPRPKEEQKPDKPPGHPLNIFDQMYHDQKNQAKLDSEIAEMKANMWNKGANQGSHHAPPSTQQKQQKPPGPMKSHGEKQRPHPYQRLATHYQSSSQSQSSQHQPGQKVPSSSKPTAPPPPPPPKSTPAPPPSHQQPHNYPPKLPVTTAPMTVPATVAPQPQPPRPEPTVVPTPISTPAVTTPATVSSISSMLQSTPPPQAIIPRKEESGQAPILSPRIQIEPDMLLHSERKLRQRLPSVSVEDKELLQDRRGASPKVILNKVESSDSDNKPTPQHVPESKPYKKLPLPENCTIREEPEQEPIKIKFSRSGLGLTASPASDASGSHKKHKKHKKHKSKKSKKSHKSDIEKPEKSEEQGVPKLRIKINVPDMSVHNMPDSEPSSGSSSKHKHSSKESRKRRRSPSPHSKTSRHPTDIVQQINQTQELLQRTIAQKQESLRHQQANQHKQGPPLPAEPRSQPPLPPPSQHF